MLESIYKAFENFVVEFSLRRLAGALLLLAVGIAGFNILDRYSPYFTIGRLERATGLLERLAAMKPSETSDDLRELRGAIVRQLRAQVEPGPLIESFVVGPSGTASLWKFTAGLGAWLLFALAFLPSVKQDPSKYRGPSWAEIQKLWLRPIRNYGDSASGKSSRAAVPIKRRGDMA